MAISHFVGRAQMSESEVRCLVNSELEEFEFARYEEEQRRQALLADLHCDDDGDEEFGKFLAARKTAAANQ